MTRDSEKEVLPPWAIALIVVAAVLLLVGVVVFIRMFPYVAYNGRDYKKCKKNPTLSQRMRGCYYDPNSNVDKFIVDFRNRPELEMV